MRAENAIRLRVGDELDHSIELFVCDRATVRAKRKFADTIINPLLFRLLFGHSNASQLGIGVNDSGDRIIINMAIFSRDPLDAGDPLVLGLMRQHRTCDHVADRVNAIDFRFEMFVDLDSFFLIQLDADFLRAESFAKRLASD